MDLYFPSVSLPLLFSVVTDGTSFCRDLRRLLSLLLLLSLVCRPPVLVAITSACEVLVASSALFPVITISSAQLKNPDPVSSSFCPLIRDLLSHYSPSGDGFGKDWTSPEPISCSLLDLIALAKVVSQSRSEPVKASVESTGGSLLTALRVVTALCSDVVRFELSATRYDSNYINPFSIVSEWRRDDGSRMGIYLVSHVGGSVKLELKPHWWRTHCSCYLDVVLVTLNCRVVSSEASFTFVFVSINASFQLSPCWMLGYLRHGYSFMEIYAHLIHMSSGRALISENEGLCSYSTFEQDCVFAIVGHMVSSQHGMMWRLLGTHLFARR